jgi:hypothetical protein
MEFIKSSKNSNIYLYKLFMDKKNTTQKINEATTELNGGSYKPPLRPGIRKWYKKDVQPFIEITSSYTNAETYHDSLDGDVSVAKKEVKKSEKVANQITHKDYKQDYVNALGKREYLASC